MMESYIYQKITDNFVRLRFLTYRCTDNDKSEINTITDDFKRILPYIEKFGNEDEKLVLWYAIKTALEMLDSEDFRMTNDFSDAVHNICELFTETTWKKNDYFSVYIDPFRKKYGKKYFKEILVWFM
ncbi:MAG: hypothetical protein K2J11_12400 [Oscillospiraceae bacterium]|nr:hypothetical protein [Oscillospiraceae bacterium]